MRQSAITLGLLAGWLGSAAANGVVAFEVVGDAIPAPLTTAPADAARGRAIVASRQTGLCLLCHRGPFPEVRFQGNLAPDLGGAGARWSAAQLRLRLVDGRRLDPQSIMPAYHRVDGLVDVAAAWQGRPLLSAQQIEDVVAYLVTLKE
ncbi:putative cytochrome c, putative SoxX protein [Leptothrix cholodnii SP-6]|uniref:Putative cytochrome c, putative SoxX protein n=2 Tax=Leptothrix cholodnii TaxID=34029 RepID=B1Y5Z4_LEPCP|nr:putative cytochrome c, putative SoxX protein [Leptothrix cholodnii SP-6]